MTTNVLVTVTHAHAGAHVEVSYVSPTTGEKTGLAAKLQLGESANVVCHAHGDLLIEEVGGIYD